MLHDSVYNVTIIRGVNLHDFSGYIIFHTRGEFFVRWYIIPMEEFLKFILAMSKTNFKDLIFNLTVVVDINVPILHKN